MPDGSERIRQSAITAMMSYLLMLSVFHKDTTVKELKLCHPKMAVMFSHVSKYENTDQALDKKIDEYKDLLLKDAVEFYCDKISDETMIGN